MLFFGSLIAALGSLISHIYANAAVLVFPLFSFGGQYQFGFLSYVSITFLSAPWFSSVGHYGGAGRAQNLRW
jgi:hypothetical protein